MKIVKRIENSIIVISTSCSSVVTAARSCCCHLPLHALMSSKKELNVDKAQFSIANLKKTGDNQEITCFKAGNFNSLNLNYKID